MIMRMKPAMVSARSKTDLSQIAKRSPKHLRTEISPLTNLNQSLKVMTIVMKRTRLRKEEKLKSYQSREPRKSRRVLMISRRPPCKHSRLPQMSGPSNCMVVTLLSR